MANNSQLVQFLHNLKQLKSYTQPFYKTHFLSLFKKILSVSKKVSFSNVLFHKTFPTLNKMRDSIIFIRVQRFWKLISGRNFSKNIFFSFLQTCSSTYPLTELKLSHSIDRESMIKAFPGLTISAPMMGCLTVTFLGNFTNISLSRDILTLVSLSYMYKNWSHVHAFYCSSLLVLYIMEEVTIQSKNKIRKSGKFNYI